VIALLLLLLVATPAHADRRAQLDELERLEIAIAHADEQLRGATARVRELEGELTELRLTLDATQDRLAERRQRLGVRLRAMYRFRHKGFLPLLFSTTSPHELLQTARYLWWIVRADERRIADWRTEQDEFDRLRTEHDERRRRLLEQAGQVFTEREELRTLRESRKAALGTVVATGPRSRTIRTEMTTGPAAVPDVVIDLRGAGEVPDELPTEQLVPQSTFERGKGRLPLPVIATIERLDRGIDLLADAGSPIRAVASGEVRRVLTIRGFGLVAIVDHGDGWHSVYGHAEGFDVQPGQAVRSGEVIGRVGESGSLKGPRLHFEIRHDREPVEPLDWLRVPSGVTVR